MKRYDLVLLNKKIKWMWLPKAINIMSLPHLKPSTLWIWKALS